MNSDLLSKADNSIKLVEQQLTVISQLTSGVNQVSAQLEELKQSEAEIINSDDKKRVAKLIAVRAEIDCVTADASRIKAEISAAKDAVFALAGAANNHLHGYRDQLIEDRKAEVRRLLEQAFEPRVVQLLEVYLNYSKSVRALEITRACFMRDRAEHNVSESAKLRGQLDTLRGNSPAAAESPEPVQLVPEPSIGNSLGRLS